MQKYKTAREKINQFVRHMEEKGDSYSIKTKVKLSPDASYAFAKAKVVIHGVATATAHKLFFQKEDVNGQKDATFAAGAETIAIARAIALLIPDNDEMAVQEEFDELLLFTVKRVNELFQISGRSAREYVNTLQNTTLRERASIYLESLFTKTAMQAAIKPEEDGNEII